MRPILFSIGPVQIHTYTVCMLTAVLLGGWLTYREAQRRMRLDHATLMVGSIGLVAGVLGAKVSMLVFLGPSRFWAALPTLPAQGAALTGALVSGYVAVALAERLLGVTKCTGDLVAPFLPLGQAIGRLGNLLAGDAYGNPTSLPWGIQQAGAFRHPVQGYEMVLDLALFGFLMWRRRRTYRDGELFRLYIVGYALIRFPLESLRYQPSTPVWLGLTLVQWLCIGAVLLFGYQLLLQRKGVACVCALFPRLRRGQAISA
jgi:phosphatidylglycerol---prolipoprotein diacylglyceryl transferase